MWIMGATGCWAWRWKKLLLRRMLRSSARPTGWPLVTLQVLPTARAPAMPSWWTAKAKALRLPGDRGGVRGETRATASGPGRGSPRSGRLRLPGWRAHPPDDECGARSRYAAFEGIRRRRHRPVPHRAAIHAGRDHARLADQRAFYKSILDAAGDKPVFRTLDLVANKALLMPAGSGRKSALGWRATASRSIALRRCATRRVRC